MAQSGGPRVLSVNVGGVRTVEAGDRTISTAIWKRPVEGRVPVAGVNLSGDDQADRSVHGGHDKAVYAYAWEDTAWWHEELGRELVPGNFGENLTLEGVVVPDAVVGEHWRVGSALLEVSEPRFPCFKLGIRMGDPRFVRRFAAVGRPGAYLRIISAGEVGAGDEIEVIGQPGHGVTIALFAHAYLRDRSQLVRLLAARQLTESWRTWIVERLEQRAGDGARVGDGELGASANY
jgi:MOSC domain-containing protein YiiM